ncbi:signal peptide peptidase-like 4 [Senna tora]|uniref:Signal peptide peptidase-like 4 n=1 Tax=Senna tora TaxID=362788 RepID=A0A834SQZ4_9FABA|nr:signal peptide peptidase-like 4 [Senna tora]
MANKTRLTELQGAGIELQKAQVTNMERFGRIEAKLDVGMEVLIDGNSKAELDAQHDEALMQITIETNKIQTTTSAPVDMTSEDDELEEAMIDLQQECSTEGDLQSVKENGSEKKVDARNFQVLPPTIEGSFISTMEIILRKLEDKTHKKYFKVQLKMLDEMLEKATLSGKLVTTGYVSYLTSTHVDVRREFFDQMLNIDCVYWNTMIIGSNRESIEEVIVMLQQGNEATLKRDQPLPHVLDQQMCRSDRNSSMENKELLLDAHIHDKSDSWATSLPNNLFLSSIHVAERIMMDKVPTWIEVVEIDTAAIILMVDNASCFVSMLYQLVSSWFLGVLVVQSCIGGPKEDIYHDFSF